MYIKVIGGIGIPIMAPIYKLRDWIPKNCLSYNFLYLNPHPAAEQIIKDNMHMLQHDIIDAICQDISGERQKRMLEYYNFKTAQDIENYIQTSQNGIKWYLITRFPFAIDVLERYIPDKTKWFWSPLSINPEIFIYDYDSMRASKQVLNEAIIQAAWHPTRIQRWLDSGLDLDDLENL